VDGQLILTARVGANAGSLYTFSGKAKVTDNTVFLVSSHPVFIKSLLDNFDLRRLSFGTGQPLVKASELQKLKLLSPGSPTELLKIERLFKTVDNYIALHQRKVENLQKLKKSLLQQMFVSGNDQVPKIRFKGFADAWEQRKLSQVTKITMGQSPLGTNYTNNPNDHILVQGNADMKDGHVVPRVWTKQVTKKAEAGELILSVRAPVGDVGVTDFPVVLGRGVAGIQGNAFIFQLLSKMKIDNYWIKFSSGSTFESINSKDVKNAEVCVPTNAEQDSIGKFFGHLDETIALHQRKVENLQKLKKSLLRLMFI
jgi:type I restriction enzyme S subunit